ncbi:MAG: hypothetical protein Aureis2KO_30820 [Aureisphaera sp.]
MLFLISTTLFSQEQKFNEHGAGDIENTPAVYVKVDKSAMKRSPAYRIYSPNYFTVQTNVDENGNNIIGDAANEPSLAVDPTNPDRIVMGWRQFDDAGNYFRQAGYAYSLNGGYDWTNPGVLDPGAFRSDPVLDMDAEGNFYYNSYRPQEGQFCDVYRITDGGVVWEEPATAFGGDKAWMRIDRSNGIGAGNIYSYWSSGSGTCDPNHFTRSTDGGQTFEDCVSVLGNPFWGTMAVDGSGTLYVTGTTAINTPGADIVVAKSTTAKDPSSSVTWDSSTIVDLDGYIVLGSPSNPGGLMGQVWVDVDISGTVADGNVYVLASVARESNSDPADVMFAKSIDGGISFSSPIRINTDVSTSNYQWFGTMSVAPNGRIDVVWLDTRDAPTDTVYPVLYYSFSEDQGDTWSLNEAISLQFDPYEGNPSLMKLGDYIDMVSDNDFAHLAWTNTLNGGHDVYYTRISPFGILSTEDDLSVNSKDIAIYPNPARDQIIIAGANWPVSTTIYDAKGTAVLTVMTKNKVDVSFLKSGLYFVKLEDGTDSVVRKLIKE